MLVKKYTTRKLHYIFCPLSNITYLSLLFFISNYNPRFFIFCDAPVKKLFQIAAEFKISFPCEVNIESGRFSLRVTLLLTRILWSCSENRTQYYACSIIFGRLPTNNGALRNADVRQIHYQLTRNSGTFMETHRTVYSIAHQILTSGGM